MAIATTGTGGGYKGTGTIVPTGDAPAVPTGPTTDQLANRTAAVGNSSKTNPVPVEGGYMDRGDGQGLQPINRPVMSPPGGSGSTSPGFSSAPTPRSANDIYGDYVKQGQSVLDSINAIYDNAVKSSNLQQDQAASKDQENQGALAAASGLLGSSAAVRGSAKIAGDTAAKKGQLEADIRSKQAGDVSSYLQTLQSAAQTQANTEVSRFPTLDTYFKTQAGNAFKGLAASGVDWNKLSSTPAYADAYSHIVQNFGGDADMAKLAFIASSKDSQNSQYLNQDPIQSADGSWIFLKQVTNPDGTTSIQQDKVDVGGSLAQGESLATLGGKPYAITKKEDGTMVYRPLATGSSTAAQGFSLGSNQSRYELNPDTGKYELVASKGEAPGSGTNDKLLSVADAASLGVPYGTTVGQAAALGKMPGQDTVKSLAQQLVEGQLAPSELSKRATGSVSYNDVLKAAQDYSKATYGKDFSIAQADRDYKFAVRPQTQDTLNYLGSLVGSDDGKGNLSGGNLDDLVTLSNGITRTDFPALNDASSWARYSAGDPKITEFQAVATEVADQVAKILQGGGGGGGTSDAKLQQAANLFNTGFSKEQMIGVVNSLKPLLKNRAKSMVKDNPYLSDYADQFGIKGSKDKTDTTGGSDADPLGLF